MPKSNTDFLVTIVAGAGAVVFRAHHPENINDLMGKFFSIFPMQFDEAQKRVIIQQTQTNNSEIRERAAAFVAEFRNAIPEINKLNTYLKNLEEGEMFMLFPYANLDKIEHYKVTQYLLALKTGEDYQKLWQEAETNYGGIFESYDFSVFDESTRRRIGEQNKSKRVCRFCHNSRGMTSFRKIAHAISESLGNRYIVLNEECDACNQYFGNGIELDLPIALRVYLAMTGIRGKNGIAKAKGKNFTLSNESGINLHLKDRVENIVDYLKKLNLETNDQMAEQNIYRALCKFALGVIENTYLPEFANTIDWINGTSTKAHLPKIAQMVSNKICYHHPCIITYVRKAPNKNLPLLVAELRVSVVRLLYIVPTFNPIEPDFCSEKEYDVFWNFFKHYHSAGYWLFLDYSNDVKRKVTYKLRFKKKNSL